tara:strand:+ start:253 stop:3261 length:3009 start_codon:yes stop_codon:yes gene_type:complete
MPNPGDRIDNPIEEAIDGLGAPVLRLVHPQIKTLTIPGISSVHIQYEGYEHWAIATAVVNTTTDTVRFESKRIGQTTMVVRIGSLITHWTLIVSLELQPHISQVPDIGMTDTDFDTDIIPPEVEGCDESWSDEALDNQWDENPSLWAPPVQGIDQGFHWKQYLSIDYTNYDNNLDFEPEWLFHLNEYPNIEDKFRAITGNYWTGIEGSNELVYFRTHFPRNYMPIDLHFKSQPAVIYNNTSTGLFFKTTQTVVFVATDYRRNHRFYAYTRHPDPSGQSPSGFISSWEFLGDVYKESIENIAPSESQWFTDHTCVINALYGKKEDPDKAAARCMIYDQYNSYIEPYELMLEQDAITEWSLPNFYAFHLMGEKAFDEPDEVPQATDFDRLITGDNSDVRDTLGWRSDHANLNDYSVGEYYPAYAAMRLNELVGNNTLTISLEKYKNIIIPYEDIEDNKNLNDRGNHSPMFVYINFKTDRDSFFADKLQNMGIVPGLSATAFPIDLSTMFAKYIVSLLNGPVNDIALAVDTFEYGISQTDEIGRNNIKRIKQIDLTEFFKLSHEGNLAVLPQDEQSAILGLMEDLDTEQVPFDSWAEIFYKLVNESMNPAYENLSHFPLRTYQDIMDGKPAYSETVMYRIAKYEKDPGEGSEFTEIQNIYLPNTSTIEDHEYIDTQVKYGKTYMYRIFGYQLVVGNKYRYKDLEFCDDDRIGYRSSKKKVRVVVENEPSIRLLETQLFEQIVSVMDHPPMAPDVYMVPFKGVNNKIRHLINNNIGEVTTQPITIESGELKKYNKWRKAKGLAESSPDGITPGADITFKSDDIAKKFEIYRMTTRPKTYEDFAGQNVLQKSTDVDIETQVASMAFDDDIQPNQKYYYMFRSIDVHGQISLPTEVYEVEMVDDEGVIYPIIKAITKEELETPDTNVISKSFKRFLKIKPATPQIFFKGDDLDYSQSAPSVENPLLGIPEESMWDKSFRVRLTSKQTGKKIDINFKFTHKHKDDEGIF